MAEQPKEREEITVTNYDPKKTAAGWPKADTTPAAPKSGGTKWWAWGLGALSVAGTIALIYFFTRAQQQPATAPGPAA